MRLKTVADYETEILELAKFTEMESKLEYKLTKWFNKSSIVVYVAQNEKQPWTEIDIGFKCEPMRTKSKTGYSQVGDYMFSINGVLGSLVVERKSLEDLFGTLFVGRDRFYREIERYESDERFDEMYIIAETSLVAFLDYKPYNPRKREYITTFSKQRKIGTISSLFARKCPVIFASDKNNAARLYGAMIRQHVLKNWRRYIGGVTV